MGASRAGDEFAAANMPNQLHLPPHVAPVEIKAVAVGVETWNGAAKQLSQQNVSQGFHNGGRSALQQVRDADMKPTGRQSDEAIGVGELAKLHADLGWIGPGLQTVENTNVDFARRLEKQSALQSTDGVIRRKVFPARLHFIRI